MSPDDFSVEVLQRGLVQVDALKGTVASRRFAGKTLGTINNGGYRVCTIRLNGQRKQLKIHRLIWISVFGIPPKGLILDHINRKKLDNRIINLRAVDSKENAHNRRSYRGSKNPSAKITATIANAIREKHRKGYSYSEVARKFQVSRSLIARIVRGELWR